LSGCGKAYLQIIQHISILRGFMRSGVLHFESPNQTFHSKVMPIWVNTTFLIHVQALVYKMTLNWYIYQNNFSIESKISSCNFLVCILYNSMGLTKFWCAKKTLSWIFQNFLSLAHSKRENYYGMPHCQFFNYEYEIYTWNTLVHLISNVMDGTQFWHYNL
jgi:hypothetical protein